MRSESLKGIACMAFGMFLFSGADTLAKLLTSDLHPVQIVWSRQLGLLVGVLVLLAIKGRGMLRSANPKLQIARGVLAVGSGTFFIFAIAYVPLADAVAVSFVAPFVVTVLGALVLKERVGRRRWMAVGVGFLGMLMVIRPGLGVVHPAMLLVVVAATFFALRQILSRVLSGADSTLTTVAYTAITSSLILTVPLPFVWQMPDLSTELPLLLGLAALAACGETLVIKSLELAQAVVLAPVHYSLIIWGTGYGYFVFGQLPDMWTWAGAAVIMATGLYVIHRERLAKT
ncbi:DMT family transporter [uncultured Litoreibacter sp.]|uniref:DMT family transporter n=1 Tax=uncultured Litoreibacter sp. TaxID=1392394 RepID=UPI00262A45AD|nr:DMT family transporter [uncultured Litoreibacter sp.]